MMLNLTDIVAFYTVIQLLFLTTVSLNYKKGKRLSSRILAGFMASNALLIGQYLLTNFLISYREKFTLLFSIGSASYLLLMPFLYLYILSLCYDNFRLKRILLLHFVLFLAAALFTFAVNSISNDIKITGLIAFSLEGIRNAELLSRRIIIHLQILSYLIASIIVLVSYRRRIKEMYSSVEKIDLWWCNLLLAGFTLMWSLDVLSWLLTNMKLISLSIQHWMFFFSLVINLSFTIAVTYRGLLQSESFSGIQEYPKYISSRLKAADCKAIIQKLTAYMINEKPYLKPSLSVDDLTKSLNIPARNLSQAIHTSLNKNFYDLINAYRIEEVKKLMQDENSQNQTLLALAYSSGFNSKSVFNAAFKKHTGMTPKEYKSKHFLLSGTIA